MRTPAILQAFKNDILPAGAQLLQADDPVTVGGHRLAGRLRSSGAGVVYLARDRGAGLVTIKTTHAEAPGPVRDRLRTEAACARRLPSACTAQLLHDGTDQTPPYLVSEHVEGPSLERVVDVKGPLAATMVMALAADLARTLAAIHDAGVLHGNLTPANILFTKDGLRVIDFGVAQEFSSSGEPAEIGAVADNPGWLAPELLTGGPPSPACDVFGWGSLVVYAATGHSPYGEKAADAPARFRPFETGALDEPVRRLVDASVAEDSAGRPTAADLTTRLDALADPATDQPAEHDVPDDRPAPTMPGHRSPRRTRARATVSTMVTLAALLVAVPTVTERFPGPPVGPPSAPHKSPREGPHAKPVPRAANTAAISLYGQPPSPGRRTRSPERATPRSPRATIWMSCASVRSGWCSMSGAKGGGIGSRSSGWRITWASGG